MLKKKRVMYNVFLPKEGVYSYTPDFHSNDIFLCLDYAYGVGPFILTSSSGFRFEFIPEEYTEDHVKNAGYFESFDFVTNNILTNHELNKWKLYLRTKDML